MKSTTYQQTTPHKCPYCKVGKLETMDTAHYVRGFILAYQIGKKSFIGCVPCVKKKMLGEAGLSALLGWFSITALIINPFLIIYNLIKGLLVSPKPYAVRKKLKEIGIPENMEEINVTQIGYALAVIMIKADGKVEESEIQQAEEIGENIFDDFDEAGFRMLLKKDTQYPSVADLAQLLNQVMPQEGKITVFKYLMAIAMADGNIDASEKEVLNQVARNLGIKKEMLQAT